MEGMRSKLFRDNVHGYIDVPHCVVERIIDTRLFQRLGDVEQTSMRPLYPAARHDRFIHSLGVYHLGKQAIKAFRSNVEEKIGDEPGLVDKNWWDKYELLFSLACLLHDVAHAPFSHTYEIYYGLRQTSVTFPWLERLHFSPGDYDTSILRAHVATIDHQLLWQCHSAGFRDDYGLFFWDEEHKLRLSETGPVCSAKEHEKLSATMIGVHYRGAVRAIEHEMLEGNPLVSDDGLDSDIEFMARCIIGLRYTTDMTGGSVEASLKNCLIYLLNSKYFDVDGLDYTMRDATNAGIGTGDLDVSRLFRSLTAARVIEVEAGSERVGPIPLDGLWLAGGSLTHHAQAQAPEGEVGTLTMEGSFTIVYEDDASSPKTWLMDPQGNLLEQSTRMIDEPTASGGVIYTREGKTASAKIHLERAPNLYIEFTGSTIVEGGFIGRISGRMVCEPKSNPEALSHAADRYSVEYELAYNQPCLNVIDNIMSARNFEYEWIYTHQKVLYQSNFLLCYLLRLSARFCCCKEHAEQSGFGRRALDCVTCVGEDGTPCAMRDLADRNDPHDPDQLIPRILGMDAFYDGKVGEQVGEPTFGRTQRLAGRPFSMSSDSDMRALFNEVMLENSELYGVGDGRDLCSQSIETAFRRLFERSHQRPLWKTRAEFNMIFCEPYFSEDERTGIIEYAKGQRVTAHASYKFPDKAIADLFEDYGLHDPVIVPARVNLKRIDRESMLIATDWLGVTTLSRLAAKTTTDAMAGDDFFYVYADLDDGEADHGVGDMLSPKKIRDLFHKVLDVATEQSAPGVPDCRPPSHNMVQ